MAKTRPNEPCPCGSGVKYKKCCGSRARPAGYSREERASALSKLGLFLMDHGELAELDDEAFDQFWGRWGDDPRELPEQLSHMSEHVGDLWFAVDFPLDDGRVVVDVFLDEAGERLSEGEKRYLRAIRGSSMRLYEIEDLRPGESVSLHDLLEGDRVTVHEKSGSRTLLKHEWVAARVVTPGASGLPEIDGILQVPVFNRPGLLEQLRADRDAFVKETRSTDAVAFYKGLPPIFHDVWISSILEPHVPELANTDGEPLTLTETTFNVSDVPALESALNKESALEREHPGQVWRWSGDSANRKSVLLGTLTLKGGVLRLETNSVARGERGRALIESAAGSAVRHRSTTHEDGQRRVRERMAGEGREPDASSPGAEIPPQIEEALSQDYYARHYRGWLDDSIPALDGQTPRAAAKEATLRPKLERLLSDLDEMYQRSLKIGVPVFDPSWMREELGLSDDAPTHPPPLPHERVAQLVPRSGEVCRSVAAALRTERGFDDAKTTASPEVLRANLDLQRFLREHQKTRTGLVDLGPYLELMVNFELHHRKCFWVDEALAFMLGHTELDVLGRELRVPFPSFALVFTDRYVLSLAERVLSRREETPAKGQYLKLLTVFVTERDEPSGRTADLTFACDPLGADLPSLAAFRLALEEEAQIAKQLDAIASVPAIESPLPLQNPLRELLQMVVNAILYATSAGPQAETRRPPSHDRAARRVTKFVSSEEVYFLPGAIEISQLRRMQALERAPDGRGILRRFMVRGHWRRPAASWTEQRMKWIQPYWKGPDMAVVIERSYKLTP